jgi:tetratricopeptide (TPR) repeat protein
MARLPHRLTTSLAAAALAALGLAGAAAAQAGVTVPPSGGNQRQTILQQIGLVRVSIDYSSPHVHSPTGEDRKGKIWGQLVPYGMANLGFGTCGDQCPWRGGANENTVFTTSHDIKVEGQPLAAGAYGLHFLPGPDEWTVIFSHNSTSWGSFFYDAKEDALRVKVKPETSDYHEVLSYEFPERRLDKATLALKWENLAVPIHLTVDNANQLYVDNLRRELRSSPGFTPDGWLAAANFALTSKIDLEEAQGWAQHATDPNLGGHETFPILTTLAQLQSANGHPEEAAKTMDRALLLPGTLPTEIHAYGRQLLALKKPDEALKVFQLNAKLHPNAWPVHVGLARGYSAVGRNKEALAEAKLALPQAPDGINRKTLEDMIQTLEAGKSIN